MSLMPGFLDKYGSVARAYQSICKAAIWRSPLKACPRAGPWSVHVAAQSSSVGGGQSILVAAGVTIVGMITRPVTLSRCYMPGPAQACSDRRLRALQSRIDKRQSTRSNYYRGGSQRGCSGRGRAEADPAKGAAGIFYMKYCGIARVLFQVADRIFC